MNNYIMVNGRQIELTDEQVKLILSATSEAPAIHLSEVAVGDTFKIGEHEFIVLEHSGDTTAVIRKDLLPDSKFGDTNNYKLSLVDGVCDEFADEIASIIEYDNIVRHTVDLTSNDGLKDYGKAEDRRCSLLTADLYRRYVEILDNFKPDNWWWLATPWSTKRHESDRYVLCVSPVGFIDYYGFRYGVAVRPFCILKSTIFVSK